MGVELTIVGVIIVINAVVSIIGFYFPRDVSENDQIKKEKENADNDIIPDNYDIDDANDGIIYRYVYILKFEKI